MTTARKMIDWAHAQLGYVEGPRDNETRYGEHTGYQYQPWCGSWVNTGFDETGLAGEPSVVWTPGGARRYQQLGRWVDRHGEVKPGDLVFFDWQGGQAAAGVDHVGLVVDVLPDGRVVTIEGNTSPDDRGSQSNGGGVYKRVRNRGTIAGFGRPAYKAEDVDMAAVRRWVAGQLLTSVQALPNLPTLGQTPQTSSLYTLVLQRALNVVMSAGLVEDGKYAKATTDAVVRYQEFWNAHRPGTIKDFPGAAHEGTRWMLATQLQAIRDGKA